MSTSPNDSKKKRCNLGNKSLTIYRLGVHCLPGSYSDTVPLVADMTQSESNQLSSLLPCACASAQGLEDTESPLLSQGLSLNPQACQETDLTLSPTLISSATWGPHLALCMGTGDLNSHPWRMDSKHPYPLSYLPSRLSLPSLMTASHTISSKCLS